MPCASVRYTAGMVWFNEQRDEWLQMRRTMMKVAPVATATDVNKRRGSDNEASPELDHQQQQQQQHVTDVVATPPSR